MARFRDRFIEDHVTAMVDHIMFPSGLQIAQHNPNRIWIPYDDNTLQALRRSFTYASDHFPVTLDLA